MGEAIPSIQALAVGVALITTSATVVPAVPVYAGRPVRTSAPTAPDARADRVLGQADFTSTGAGSTGDRLNTPAGIAIVPPGAPAHAQPGRIFIADFGNYRVLSWPSASSFSTGQKADLVIGQINVDDVVQPASASAQHTIGPESVVVDGNGNLYVADTLGHRVLLFKPPFSSNMSAERVFGQGSSGTNFTSASANSSGINANSAHFPRGVAVDWAGNLYIADDFNHRILIFTFPTDTDKSAAVTADVVLGQVNMNGNAAGGGASGIEHPKGVAVDGVGNVYVASWADNRVLAYQPPLSNGRAASRVFGQGSTGTSFGTNTAGTSATAMNKPIDVALDTVGNLYVSDQHNNRVLFFNAPTGVDAASAVTADFVYGQGESGSNFGAASNGPASASQFYRVNEGTLGIAIAGNGALYVAEFDAHRVLAFDPADAIKVIGNGTPESCTAPALEAQLTSGGTIAFNCGDAPKLIVLTSQKTINTPVTLDGGGKITLSGNDNARLFWVGVGKWLTLQNITLTNGYSPVDGGAIHNDGSLLILNSTIQNSRADASGGAIVNYGWLALMGSTIKGNSGSNAGAIYSRFPGSYTRISRSRLHNNRAIGTADGWGGAILPWDGANVALIDSEVTSNTARLGGGVHNRFANSTVSFENVRVHSNIATLSGGGVYNQFGSIDINQTTFSANSADRGGGIDNRSGTTTINNATFSGNSSTSYGGAIYNLSGGIAVSFTTFSHNAAGEGGSIVQDSPRAMILRNVVLENGAGTSNCFAWEISAAKIVSTGFNVSADGSCSPYFNQPSDKNNTNPLLGPLAENGGLTPTHLPVAGSPLIDSGMCIAATGMNVDQRGVARPQGAACDVGAVEVRSADHTKQQFLPLAVRL